MFVSQIIDEASEVLATSDRSKVFRKLQQAVQALMESGHWFHTNAEVDVCTGWDGQTITLPKNIEVPLAVNVDGSPTYFRGRLFQYHVNKGGMYNPVPWAWDDRGFVSTLMDIRQPAQLVAVAEHEADAGVQLRVVGTDINNRDLRDQTEDGTGVDGMILTTHALSDYAFGTIAPDGVKIQTRETAVDPFIRLSYVNPTTPSTFTAGQAVTVTPTSGTFPSPLESGGTYYVGTYLTGYLTLHLSRLDAINGDNPVRFSNVGTNSTITLTNSRSITLDTVINVSTYPAIPIPSPCELSFALGVAGGRSTLPSPLVENATYFATPIESKDASLLQFRLYPTLADASAGTNQINLLGTGSGSGQFFTRIRKQIAPQTTLRIPTASVSYSNGDAVEAYTNGGTLPEPLITGQTYYVHVVDSSNVTLHTVYEDSISGANPITLTTSGTGQNSIAKLIPATANPGTKNNISVNGLTLPAASGSGASAVAYASGPVTSAAVANTGSGYSSAVTASFSDTGGYDYASAPVVSISGGTYTTPASATAVLATDYATGKKYVASITIDSGGSGYTTANPPTVTFIGGLNTGGVAAQGTAVISGGAITGITLTPYGSGATASVSINTVDNRVNGIVLTNAGSGYLYPPRISLAGPVSVASITITTGSSSGTITALTITDRSGVPTNLIGSTFGPNAAYTNTTTCATALASAVNGVMGSGYAVATGNTVTFPGASGVYNVSATLGGTTPFLVSYAWPALAASAITTSFITRFELTSGGSGYSTVPAVYLSGGGGTGASAVAVTDSNGIASTNIISGGSGYPSVVTASIVDTGGGTGTGATAVVSVVAGVITAVTITNPGVGYSNPSISFSGSPTTPANVTLTKGTVVTGIEVVTQGTGYTSAPSVSIIPSTGYFVQFSSTGTLPSPLEQGNSYRAEGPSTSGSFTVKNADFSDVNITSTGSGTFYVVVGRTFGIGFNDLWSGDFTGMTSGDQVFLASDYQLPITNPTTSSNTAYYLSKLDNSSAYLYADSGFSTLIKPIALGTGQSYYAAQYTVTARAYLNQLTPDSLEGLQEGLAVKFSPSTALPYPLTAVDTYYVSMHGKNIGLTTDGTSPVAFVNGLVPTLASNVFTLELAAGVIPSKSTALNFVNGLLETGTQVSVRPSENDTLPVPLTASTYANAQNYYARRIASGQIELYDSKYNAQNLTSTIGRISFTTPGSSVDSIFFVDAIYEPVLVKTILHVEKPVTQGYISLYAFDYGRSNDLCLIGQYHPTETNPKYRRIRLGTKCAWARILYRIKAPEITSVYDYIPIENPRAVLLALHAVDLEDKDFMEQAQKYWAMAFQYLKNQQESMDGHAIQTPQISGIVYGDSEDPVMF